MSRPRRADAAGLLLAAIDLGSSKASCLIARRDGEGGLTPLGVGRQTMRRGADSTVVDIDSAARLLAVAADEAQRMAGAPFPSAAVAYGGPGVACTAIQGIAAIPQGGVNARAIEQAIGGAARAGARKGRRVLSLSSVRFRIDGAADPLGDPLGQMGSTLSCEAFAITAPEAAIEALEQCCALAGLPIGMIVPAASAAAAAALTPQERAAGVVLVDMGAAFTASALLLGGDVVWLGGVDCGGDAVTDALASALATTRAAAERLKIAHSDLSEDCDPAKGVVEFARLSEDGRLTGAVAARSAIDATVRGAILDGLGAVRRQLDGADRSAGLPVVLCGGGAMIPGLAAVAERVLGRRVRIGSPIGFGVLDAAEGGPGYAVSCGLLRLFAEGGAYSAQSARAADHNPPKLGANLSKAWGWLRENF
jgi:cell division protein FtsA